MKRSRSNRRKGTASIEEEISKITEDLASPGQTLGESASEEARAAIHSLRQRVDRLADNASSLTEDAIEGAEKTITDNPFIAIGAAFGVGVVLSALLPRR